MRRRNLPVTSRFCALSLLVAIAVCSAPARADEYDAAFTRAIAAKERALDTNDPASWQAAVDLFIEANRIRSTKESRYELGSAAARLKQDDVAVEAFEAALALGLTGPAADKARAFVDEHAKAMARVEVRGAAGAEIWLAARWRGTLPLDRPLVVFAGKRRFELRFGGDRDEQRLAVSAGQPALVDFTRVRRPLPPTADTLAPGPDRPPATAAPPDSTLAWALTIGGAGLTILSSATLGLSFSNVSTHRDRLADLCAVSSHDDTCAAAKPGKKEAAQSEVDSIASWKSARTASYVGVGAGVLAAGVGVVMLLSTPERKRAPKTGFALWPSSGGAQLGLFGSLR
jgi:hypothetical protein